MLDVRGVLDHNPTQYSMRSIVRILILHLVLLCCSKGYSFNCNELTSKTDRDYCEQLDSIPFGLTGGTSGKQCGYAIEEYDCSAEKKATPTIIAESLTRNDIWWNDDELRAHCLQIKEKRLDMKKYRILATSVRDVLRSESCLKRNFTKKCYRWSYRVSFSCRYEKNEIYTKVCKKTTNKPLSCDKAYIADLSIIDFDLKSISSVIYTLKY